MPNRRRRLTRIGPTITLAVLATGCGAPEVVPVSGRVLVDGEPLRHGTVRFLPESGPASAAMLDEQGRFTLLCYTGDQGAVLGHHRIEVAGSEVVGESDAKWHAPPKYADFRTSGLTVDITQPTENLVLELSWQGARASN